jgi:5-methylcytosine-specific restriction endonuclease McrA
MNSLRTLVLNPYMQPHRLAGWQEAICLLVTGKCDVLEHYEATVSSPSITIHVPAVVRLKRDISMYKKGVKFSRINVLTRDGFRCCYCGHKKPHEELNYDHVVPRAQGGKTVWENIVTSCYRCNTRKDRRTPEQAGMRMHFKPHRPRTLPMTQPMLLSARDIAEPWKPYLQLEARTA